MGHLRVVILPSLDAFLLAMIFAMYGRYGVPLVIVGDFHFLAVVWALLVMAVSVKVGLLYYFLKKSDLLAYLSY
jgi:hypothetical protein